MHFEKLNYSFANETTEIELSYLADNCASVFCIAGSGSRFLPLLSKDPRRIDVVDSSKVQLYLAELRYQALKQLDYDSFLKILGYQKAKTEERLKIFNSLQLRQELVDFWLAQKQKWTPTGFIFIGAWEKKLNLLRKIFYFFHLKDLDPVFTDKKIKFPSLSWSIFCNTVLSEALVRRLLYSGQSRYNLSISFGEFLKNSFFQQIQNSADLEKEFFMQFVFCRKLLSEKAWPAEAQKNVFMQAKAAKTDVRFIQKNLIDVTDWTYNFYSFSDCFSYLSDFDTQRILDQIAQQKNPARLLLRFFMYQPHLNYSQYKVTEVDPRLDYVPIYKIHMLEKV